MRLLKRLKAAWLILISKDMEYEHYKRGFEHGLDVGFEDGMKDARKRLKPQPPEVQND
jgi:hypothetical protein